MSIEIIKLTKDDNEIIDIISKWNYEWWGTEKINTLNGIKMFIQNACQDDKIPQTFVALIDKIPAGMYQFTVSPIPASKIYHRPDLYPYLTNVYVDKIFREQGVGKVLMKSVRENLKKLDIKELYLYTSHVGFYEKYGWKLYSNEPKSDDISTYLRIYKLEID